MSRNVSGTYSLYTPGNPVVPSTVITTTWANNTLSDIATALTDSLSRSGQGGMSASLGLAAGVIGAPGLSWTAETTSGLYRAGAGDFRYSITATDILQVTANGLKTLAGTNALPSHSFIADPDSGMYSIGANNIGVAVNATKIIDVSTTGVAITGAFQVTGQFQAPDGLVGTPGYAFALDPNTGIYRIGNDNLGVTAGGTKVIDVATTGVAVTGTLGATGVISASNGGVGTPAYAFTTDPTTGLYRIGASNVGIAAGGTKIVDIATSGVAVTGTLGATGAVLVTGDHVSVSNTDNYYESVETDQGANGKVWWVRFTGGSAALQTRTDGLGSGTNAWTCTRTGTTVNQMLLGPDGAAGTPTLAWENDPNTGFYSFAADVLGFSEGGTGYRVGFRSVPRSTTATTLVLADNGRCVAITAAIAIPASVFAAGDVISLYNDSAASVNVTIAAGTLRLAGTTTTGTRALAARGSATLWFNVGGATPEVIASGPGLS